MQMVIDDRLAGLIQQRLHPMRIVVDASANIARVEGDAAFFGYAALRPGDRADEQIPYLVGLSDLPQAELPMVETPSGKAADLYWVLADDGTGTLTVFDSSDRRDEVQTSQQLANETMLLQYRLRQASEALRLKQQELLHIAYHDSLTGLFNRRQLFNILPDEIQRARDSGAPLALLLIDIDYFKGYNDRYGHLAGDACLHKVAQMVGANARRPADVAARVGGEEFALLLPDTTLAAAFDAGQRLCHDVNDLQYPHLGSPNGIVTISVGVALLSASTEVEPWELLYKEADKALYRAKRLGRNRVSFPEAAQQDGKPEAP